MIAEDEAGASTQVARTVVQSLLDGGVADVVLCPGSRSAPLAYAVRAADRAGRLRLHVRIDERTGGFLALGLARGSGRPVAVITTSGTAVGNLLPAVMEAYHSRIPVLVLSADRPGTMINTGANQTTVQPGLFAGHLRAEARIAAADRHPRAWRFATDRLLALATARSGGVAGPGHLDLELTDPLTPPDDGWTPAPGAVAGSATGADRIEPVALAAGPRTVIVAGDLTPDRGHALADQAARAGVPLLAEPSSNARHGATAIATYRLLLGTALADRIDRVIMVGRPTLSRPGQRLLARTDVEQVIVEPSPEWIDPGLSNARPVPAVDLAPGDPGWLAEWRDADHALSRALADEPTMIIDEATARGRLSPLAVARAVINDSTGPLVLGSSNPVRDADLIMSGDVDRPVHANRGLAGIDGTVSTATGIALSHPGRTTTVLLGDLTFLHDITGLVVPVGEPRPDRLRLVVANDDGGSIFATLEYGAAELRDDFDRLFATATGVDLAGLCAGVGVRHVRVDDHDQLLDALAHEPDGVEVVEVITDRTDRPRQQPRWAALARRLVDAATP